MVTEIEFSAKLESCLAANGMSEFFSDKLPGKLYKLTERMLEVNEHMNLTAITDIDDVILKHYVDSLTASKYIPHGSSLIDVGCGAGFPSLVLAMAREDIMVTALDSTAKRINYIRETAEILGAANITCVAARAEELAHHTAYREKYDISCARAVARLNVLCELCLAYVKPRGKFIAMKANAAQELEEAQSAIRQLGGKLVYADSFELVSPFTDARDPRCIISIEKVSETREIYPRNNAQIKKKPL